MVAAERGGMPLGLRITLRLGSGILYFLAILQARRPIAIERTRRTPGMTKTKYKFRLEDSNLCMNSTASARR